MSEHVVESTFELSAFMKAGVMADSERDSSSCILDADEDSRSDLHSPTASEDSVEVQVTPISLRNKRKLAEPRKIQEPAVITAPLKKRRFNPISEETTVDQEESRSLSTASPFRPWVPVSCKSETQTPASSTTITTITTMMSNTTTTPTTTTMTSSTKALSSEKEGEKMEQDETMQRLHESFRRLQHVQSPVSHNKSIVSSRRELRQRLFEPAAPTTTTTSTSSINSPPHPRLQDEPLSLVVRNETPRVPSHPAVSGTYEKTPSYMMEHLLATSSTRNHQNHESHRNHQNHQASSTSSSKHHHQGNQQRNYKNMTRERRIEANARERTRVHTISAAFDTLRHAIPAYSHNQKLSKLSVLRIACSYIMTLSKILQESDGEVTTRNNGPTDLDGCVDLVSRTIQTEGKLRKRKDD